MGVMQDNPPVRPSWPYEKTPIEVAQEHAETNGAEAAPQKRSLAPETKITVGAGIGTLIAQVLILLATRVGIELDMPTALALSGIIIFVVGYLVPKR